MRHPADILLARLRWISTSRGYDARKILITSVSDCGDVIHSGKMTWIVLRLGFGCEMKAGTSQAMCPCRCW